MKRRLFIKRRLFLRFMKLIAPLFFDRRYLQGRHFDITRGWIWALRSIFFQKLLGFNRDVPWPTHPFNRVGNPDWITFDPDDLNNFQGFGCYFQATPGGRIIIGKGTYIAPNVGLITVNHDPCFPDHHQPSQGIVLGEQCWIGMNSVILPGVQLGAHTVVAAGAVVTKSFPEGNCVIGGVPAVMLKQLDCDDTEQAAP